MLHGFLGASDDWQAIAQKIPKSISCYAIDLPGHGQSKNIKLTQASGFAQCSELLSTTLTKHGITDYILLGYSLGGRIALYHANQKPENIKALILESCHFGLNDDTQKQQRILSDKRWANRFSSHYLPDVLNDWYQQNVFSSLDAKQKESLITLRSQLMGEAVGKMLLATSLGKQDYLAKKFAMTKIPSYYLFGEKDIKYQGIAHKFKQLCPHLNTVKLSQSGHNIHFEQPDRFSEKIIEIYTQLS